MKKIMKYMAILLCLCVSSYGLTAHAAKPTADGSGKPAKGDGGGGGTSGGTIAGSLDARFADFRMVDVEIDGVVVSQGVVEAVYANRTNADCSYTLERVSADGTVVLETLESGVVAAGQAKLASVVSTEQGYYLAKMWNSKSVGFKSQDITSSF